MKKSFLDFYSHKIINISTLKKILNKKQNKKTVQCHGVFDIVHPGHVRHLIHAKSLAEILIVSITADKFIKKGVYKPHVPQDLRAINLASFEMVDYVLIDDNPTPISIIGKIKPNFFSKGFEYTADSLPKATLEEEKEVSKYNGKMVFTPGDVVYSSTKILDSHLPNLKYEKLFQLMKNNKINFSLIKQTVKELKGIKVHIVGDAIIDTYVRTSMNSSHNKTPTHSVTIINEEDYVGGAGIVALHLKAAGADVHFTTLIGKDKHANFLKEKIKKTGIKSNFIEDVSRPTSNKRVYIANDNRLLKVDNLKNDPISNLILDQFLKSIKKHKGDAIIFSDFRHGIFNNSSLKSLINSIDKSQIRVADSQLASRWGNITDFKKFDLITPNEKEARFALGDQDSSITKLSIKLLEVTGSRNIILKLGSKGVLSTSKKKLYGDSIDGFAENILDPVGAGDALLAYSTLALIKTKSLVISSIIGNLAASCECELDGNKPITVEMILTKIEDVEKKTLI
tara:strand:+ start:3391 stop:4923 length:1533 start_codon:yes stop_codon:yes gene_type:complete